MQRVLITLSGISPQIEGKEWQSDTILRIGRLDSLEIYLNDSSISRRHAELLATEEGWIIHDLLTLLRGGYHLCHAGSLDELLLSILEDAVTILDAQGGSIILIDAPAG